MRCSGSPTTSTAANIVVTRVEPPLGQASTPSVRDVTNALLFREILKPLTAALGPAGEIALGAVADDLFVRRAR